MEKIQWVRNAKNEKLEIFHFGVLGLRVEPLTQRPFLGETKKWVSALRGKSFWGIGVSLIRLFWVPSILLAVAQTLPCPRI